MDVREKLVELIHKAKLSMWGKNGLSNEKAQNSYIAEYLIANGVTVQEWISFDEIKPKDGQSVLGITTESEMEVYQFDENWQNCLCRYGGIVKVFNITHWMPLSQPPKGE